MAGAVRVLDTTPGASISADTTRAITGSSGGHAAATFLIDVTTFTGDWTVTLRAHVGTSVVDIAELNLSATGIARLVLTSGEFDATRQAILAPDEVFYNNTVAGTLAAQIIAIYGD